MKTFYDKIMKKIKNILYVLGAIILIIRIFFGNEISNELYDISGWLCVVLFLIITVLEVITRKK